MTRTTPLLLTLRNNLATWSKSRGNKHKKTSSRGTQGTSRDRGTSRFWENVTFFTSPMTLNTSAPFVISGYLIQINVSFDLLVTQTIPQLQTLSSHLVTVSRGLFLFRADCPCNLTSRIPPCIRFSKLLSAKHQNLVSLSNRWARSSYYMGLKSMNFCCDSIKIFK